MSDNVVSLFDGVKGDDLSAPVSCTISDSSNLARARMAQIVAEEDTAAIVIIGKSSTLHVWQDEAPETNDQQKWLDDMLEEARDILQGAYT